MKFVLLTIGTVACSTVENCDMIPDALKDSIDKQDYSCKQNGMKSIICQNYIHEVQANKAELKECNAKKAEPAIKKGGYLEENCDEQMDGYKTCKMQYWKSKTCQIRQKELDVKAN